MFLVFSNKPETPPSRAQEVSLGTGNTELSLTEKGDEIRGKQ
jgi:hypothetical protein